MQDNKQGGKSVYFKNSDCKITFKMLQVMREKIVILLMMLYAAVATAQINITRNDSDIFSLRNDFWAGFNSEIHGDLDSGADNHIAAFRRFEDFWLPRLTNHEGKFNAAIQANYEYVQSQEAEPETAPVCKPANWQSLGPAGNGLGGIGRLNCLAFSPHDADVLYAGSANGGVWKYSKSANDWEQLNTDTKLERLGISHIAVDPVLNPANNKEILYVCTGDNTGLVSYSAGIYRSRNGGATWHPINGGDMQQIVTSPFLQYVHQVLLDPYDDDVMYAATSKGIYKCANRQGVSPNSPIWTKVYPIGWEEPVFSMDFEPGSNGQVIYATGYTVVKSSDYGATWTIIATAISGLNLTSYPLNPPAFPGTCIQKSKLIVADNNKMYVLFVVQANQCSYHFGICSWYKFFSFNFITQQFTIKNYITNCNPNLVSNKADRIAIAVSPYNSNHLYAGDVDFYYTTNGGGYWIDLGYCSHVDYHDIQFDPHDNNYLYLAHDGGCSRMHITSTYPIPFNCTEINGSATHGLSIAKIYNFGSSVQDPNMIAIGTQDDGLKLLRNNAWQSVYLSDCFEQYIDYSDYRNMLSIYYRNLTKNVNDFTNGGLPFFISASSDVHPVINGSKVSGGAWGRCFNIVQHPAQNNKIYFGGHNVYRNDNFSFANPQFNKNTWTQISDFKNEFTMGLYQEISSMKMAPSNPSVIYVAFTAVDNGFSCDKSRLFKTTVGGGTGNWVDITPPAPGCPYITDVEVSASDPFHIWVTYSGYTSNLKVKESFDGGINWFDNNSGLPNLPVNCIEYEAGSNDGVYIGTDVGVYYKNNSMNEWARFMDNCAGGDAIPNTIVNELEINYGINKIRAGTYGRGLWESDLVCPADWNLQLTGSVNGNEWKEAQNDIYSDQEILSGKVTNRAGNAVELNAGFIADALANNNLVYKAFIHPCNKPGNSPLPRMATPYDPEELLSSNSERENLKQDLMIYPNPTTSILQISFKDNPVNGSILIYNSEGRLVFKIENVSTLNYEINLEQYKSGLYLLKFMSLAEEVVILKKFIKQNKN